MPLTSAPSDDGVTGWLYDGRTALRQDVHVWIDGNALIISGQPITPIAALQRPDPIRAEFTRRDIPGWRLGFETLPDELAGLPRPTRFGGFIDRIGLWRAAGVFLILSAIGLLIVTQGIVFAARLIPYSWEQQLGETITGDFGDDACIAPDGQKALDSLAVRLSPAGRPIRIHVIDMPEVNAVTLPGGQILVFSKLIEEAHSPDEVAGVLAHEIGHVENRDVMVSLLRRFGLGMLMGSSDYSSQYAQTLLDLRYSRRVENEADSYSIDHLRSANISPAPTANLFDRFAKQETGEPGIFAYLGSHPPSIERSARFRNAASKLPGARPALDAAEWHAIRSICRVKRANN